MQKYAEKKDPEKVSHFKENNAQPGNILVNENGHEKIDPSV